MAVGWLKARSLCVSERLQAAFLFICLKETKGTTLFYRKSLLSERLKINKANVFVALKKILKTTAAFSFIFFLDSFEYQNKLQCAAPDLFFFTSLENYFSFSASTCNSHMTQPLQ